MSATLTALKAARSLIAFGWVEPLTLTTDRIICPRDAEGARYFCAHDAVMLGAGENVDVAMQVFDLITTFVAPLHEVTLSDWLYVPERTQAEVLRVFDRAILRAGALAKGVQHGA